MPQIIIETVLEYAEADYEEWSSGKRERWVSEPVPAHVVNQPRYHFGEYFVLSHFAKEGWAGHRFYALGEWEPNNQKIQPGRDEINRRFDAQRLALFRQIRRESGRASGTGEPDVFLCHSDGRLRFLEVKMKADRVSPAQLECLAQISAVLGGEVGIVYLRETNQVYSAKRYELDLVGFKGRVLEA